MKITATVSRGLNTGKTLEAHRHEDGQYVVSMSRFEADYIRVQTLDEVARYVKEGYSVRMSNAAEGVRASSLMAPGSIRIARVSGEAA